MIMYAFQPAQLVKVGGDCIGAIVVAFNEGSSIKLKLTRITHASIRLTCLRVSVENFIPHTPTKTVHKYSIYPLQPYRILGTRRYSTEMHIAKGREMM